MPHTDAKGAAQREAEGIKNPADEIYEHLVPCTTAWDGSMDKASLPINKSRFIVHEHKKWKFKPDAAGNIRRCVPWNYSFPEHYIHYEKELLDCAYWFQTRDDLKDKQGLAAQYVLSRKQPYIVFLYTTCNNEHPSVVPPEFVTDSTAQTQVEIDHPFKIDMNFKCHYENPLATKTVPTINKGRPLIHKAGPPKKTRSGIKRNAPMDPISRKYYQTNLKDFAKIRRPRGVPRERSKSTATTIAKLLSRSYYYCLW